MTSTRLNVAFRRLREELSGDRSGAITVTVVTHATDEEIQRIQDYALLADDGYVVLHDEQNYLASGLASTEWPKTENDGRPIQREIIYRVTSKGFAVAEPNLKRWGRNVQVNIPTILVSVVASLVAGWLAKLTGL
ncbi:hypothetical protein [Phaeobacter sp. B1627]|uniref:hypothetical protein n=1 Tax=Phaeobacter sp. B1627 TaxID=2583809 RepID=UPI00111B7B35|nr:hypothetical protein [Phaeobacter sp. B1627]TNJ43373.1 hypothetical protein FGE21_09860 [Phaeobacter sp. B1627]